MNRPFLSQNWPGSSAAPWARAAAATVARRSARLRSAVSPRAFPPSTRAALDFSLPRWLQGHAEVGHGSGQLSSREAGVASCSPEAERKGRRPGSGAVCPGHGPERVAAQSPRAATPGPPARSARASGGENPVTASPSALQPELPLVSFLGDVHLLPTCFFFLAPKILLPPMGSTRSFLLTLA